MARIFCAFINISAAKWRANKALSTFAFSAKAKLCWWTIGIRFTARMTGAIVIANFSWQAVIAGIAHLATNLLIAALAHSTG